MLWKEWQHADLSQPNRIGQAITERHHGKSPNSGGSSLEHMFAAIWSISVSGVYAFVGLSKIRKASAMDGMPLADRREPLKCGVAAVDLRSGRVVALLEFQTAVEEIFDVQLLPGLRFPEVIGFQQETIQHTFVVPRGSPAP